MSLRTDFFIVPPVRFGSDQSDMAGASSSFTHWLRQRKTPRCYHENPPKPDDMLMFFLGRFSSGKPWFFGREWYRLHRLLESKSSRLVLHGTLNCCNGILGNLLWATTAHLSVCQHHDDPWPTAQPATRFGMIARKVCLMVIPLPVT